MLAKALNKWRKNIQQLVIWDERTGEVDCMEDLLDMNRGLEQKCGYKYRCPHMLHVAVAC
jgi:hypothetical protein